MPVAAVKPVHILNITENKAQINYYFENHKFLTGYYYYLLHKKSSYWRFFWSVFSRIHTEYVKIQTRKTPNTDTFHAVTIIKISNQATAKI